MNKWYSRINNSQPQVQAPQTSGVRQFQNPMQKMQYIINAMRNPAAFISEQFPDVPENIRNNPNAVLNYLQQTRGQQFTQQMYQVMGTNVRR